MVRRVIFTLQPRRGDFAMVAIRDTFATFSRDRAHAPQTQASCGFHLGPTPGITARKCTVRGCPTSQAGGGGPRQGAGCVHPLQARCGGRGSGRGRVKACRPKYCLPVRPHRCRKARVEHVHDKGSR